MPSWIYFALIAQGIWSITSLTDKFVISKGYIKNPLVYILLNGLMNIFLVFLLPFAGFEPLKFMDFLILIAGGFLFNAAISIYYKAVQYEEISRVAILYQIGPIFVFILSFLFIGEVLSASNFIGFLLLLGAGFIVSYKKMNGSSRFSKAFYLMLASTLLSSISLIIAKYIFSITSFWSAFLWLRISGFTALSVLLLPSVRKDAVKTFKTMKPRIKALMTLKMVIDFSAFIFAGYALLNGVTSLYAALSASALPLFVFILTLITSIYLPKLVKEDIYKKTILIKLFAFVLIVIGIFFVNM